MLTRQPLVQFLSVPALRIGLPMGGVWAWALAFPLFGPLLQHAAGGRAGLMGAYYDLAMAVALAILVWLPRPSESRYRRVMMDAGAAVVVTLVFLMGGGLLLQGAMHVLLASLLVIAHADLYLIMIDAYVVQKDRLATLAVAFSTAYLLQAITAVAVELTSSLVVIALPMGVVLLLSAVGFGRLPREAEPPAASAFPPTGRLWAEVLPLMAFAVAAYGVGGIWFRPLEIAGLPFSPAFRSLGSALAVFVLCRFLWRRETTLLAPLALGAVGLGLLLAAAPISQPVGSILHRMTMTFGMMAADLFYWFYLGALAADRRHRPVFGLGLAVAWGLIGAVNLISLTFPDTQVPPQGFLLTGTAIIFAVVPLVYSLPRTKPQPLAAQPVSIRATAEPAPVPVPVPAPTPPAREAAVAVQPHTAPAPAPEAILETPLPLTAAERAVYALLIAGARDAEIAQQLNISPHTVKFHVRNILRKAGVANRTELLSQLLMLSGKQD